jgi:hypothetical protein
MHDTKGCAREASTRTVPSLGLNGLSLGEHACQVESSREVELATAAAFLRTGLERDEACAYVTGQIDDLDEVRAAFVAAGVPPVAEMQGALRLLRPREFQLRRATFDPQEMLGFVRSQVEAACESGAAGLRVAVDMTWTLSDHPGADRFLEFEALADELFPTLPLAALCQYRATRLGPSATCGALHTHRLVVARGGVCENPFHVPPDEFLRSEDPQARVARMVAALRPRG